MSGRIPLGAVRNTLLIMGATALVPGAVHAADRGTPAREQGTTPQTKAPASQSKPPAARSLASLTRQTPLGEAVDLLRNSSIPPLKILVLWKPLGEAGIYRDTPIGVDGIAGLSANQYLEFLVLSLSAGASARVGYTMDKDVITIATANALPAPKQKTRIHDISDLVAPPARYSLSSMGFAWGYGRPVVPPASPAGGSGYGSYGANPGTNVSHLASGPYKRTGQSPRTYRRH